MDREEFFRLKKVQGKKKERAEREEVDAKARTAANKKASDDEKRDNVVIASGTEASGGGGGGDMLSAGKDEDVIF